MLTERALSVAIVFPGQGSQSPGMQADLAEKYSVVADTYAEASDLLGFDLWRLVQDGPAEKLGETVVTQPAMLTAGVAAFRVWQEVGGSAPTQMAGHSLGEYTALTCAGAFEFAEAVRVVQRRAQLMQDAVPVGQGAMAAILGLDDNDVVAACNTAADLGVVEAVNFNSPGQVVIAGSKAGVEAAVAAAQAAGARRALLLPVSVPSHSSLMQVASEPLLKTLHAATIQSPAISVLNATDATPYRDADDIRQRLATQIHSPVRWVDTIRTLQANGAEQIMECGPGKVLAGLVRRIDRAFSVATLDSLGGLEKALQSEIQRQKEDA